MYSKFSSDDLTSGFDSYAIQSGALTIKGILGIEKTLPFQSQLTSKYYYDLWSKLAEANKNLGSYKDVSYADINKVDEINQKAKTDAQAKMEQLLADTQTARVAIYGTKDSPKSPTSAEITAYQNEWKPKWDKATDDAVKALEKAVKDIGAIVKKYEPKTALPPTPTPTPTPSVVPSTTPKKSNKMLYIAGGVVLLVAVGYFMLRKK